MSQIAERKPMPPCPTYESLNSAVLMVKDLVADVISFSAVISGCEVGNLWQWVSWTTRNGEIGQAKRGLIGTKESWWFIMMVDDGKSCIDMDCRGQHSMDKNYSNTSHQ